MLARPPTNLYSPLQTLHRYSTTPLQTLYIPPQALQMILRFPFAAALEAQKVKWFTGHGEKSVEDLQNV